MGDYKKLNLVENSAILDTIYGKLRQLRATKVRPNIDDKCILSWNALTLRFFAEASKYFSSERFLDLANSLAKAIKQWYVKENSLLRIQRKEVVSTPALLEDYASTIIGLLSLYEVTGVVEWFELSKRLAKQMI